MSSSKELYNEITKLKKEYAFLCIPEYIYESILNAALANNYSIKELRLLLNNYIKEKINPEEFIRLLIIKLNNELRASKDIIGILESITKLLQRLDYDLTVEQIFSLLEEVTIIRSGIDDLVTKNKKLIEAGNLYRISEDSFILTIIELYCDKNGIETMPKDTNHNEIKKDLSAINQYMDEISLPLLSPEEERRYAIEFQNGSEYARKILTERNLRLVVNIAKRFQGKGLDLLDLIQEGNIGLINAIEKFDVSKGFKLSTYATYSIRQAITKAIANKGNTISLPVYIYGKQKKYILAIKKLEQELDREPTINEIADEMNLSYPEVLKLAEQTPSVISLNAKVGEEDSELGDFIVDTSVQIEESYLQKDLSNTLLEIMSKCKISNRDIKIICCLYGLNGERKHTLAETGKLFKLSTEGVRQVRKKAIKKIRACSYVKNLALYTNYPSKTLDEINERDSSNTRKESNGIESIIYSIRELSDEKLHGLKEAISALELPKQRIILLYLGFSKDRRHRRKEKASILGLKIEDFDYYVNVITKELIKKNPNIPDVLHRLKLIRYCNGEAASGIKIEYKIVDNKELDVETRIRNIIASLIDYEQEIMNYYLGYYPGKRLRLQQKYDILCISKENYYRRIKEIIELIKRTLTDIPNIEEIIMQIRKNNNEYINNSEIKNNEQNRREHPVIEALKIKFQNPDFQNIIKNMSMNKIYIIWLYFNQYSNEEISIILRIPIEEIIAILNNALVCNQDEIGLICQAR